MLYARVVLGLPIEGPFDYIVPEELVKKIQVGVRVRVGFRSAVKIGYVVNLTRKTAIKNLKAIISVIDEAALLDTHLLKLAKKLSDYYCCSWGEAIETALPEGLRKGKPITITRPEKLVKEKPLLDANTPEALLLYDLSGTQRWETYISRINDVLARNKSVLIILSDAHSFSATGGMIKERLGIPYCALYRQQPKEIEEWAKIKSGEVKLVIGTRSAIFAPLDNLGLIIIDEEQDSVYKQEQVPHYHCREAAFMRAQAQGSELILGTSSPSLESFYLARKAKIKYEFVPSKKEPPEIKLLDMKTFRSFTGKRNVVLSRYLEDCILQTYNAKGKILLFINRRGFATAASCISCGTVLKCPRCNINLVYHFSSGMLSCHHCNYRIPIPKLCPVCSSSYLRYSGAGTEKIESDLSRIFPQAKIRIIGGKDSVDINELDIAISTESVIRHAEYNFDLVGVLAIDNSLNRLDFRSGEKTFALLSGLLQLTNKKMVIQTTMPHHHCFQAFLRKDMDVFYEQELKERRQLKFPPYQHIGLVKLRHPKESRAKEAGEELFNRLSEAKRSSRVQVVSVVPGQPEKLRNNFYWQILLKAASADTLAKFLKIQLKSFRHSGIIVTVDIDPL